MGIDVFMNSNLTKKIAVLSIVLAVIHFVGETVWHFKFGQFLPMLIVDYIAVSLLIFGGYHTLKSEKAIGLLCGAWGFEFCLNYRALFLRVEKIISGVGADDPAIGATAYLLMALLSVSIIMFSITMYLCISENKDT